MRFFAVLHLTLAMAAAPEDWTPGHVDPCHEATIREVHGWAHLGTYEILVRVKPADLEKVCIAVIKPVQIKREFTLRHPQKTVTVEARNKTFSVPVQ